MSSRKFKSDYRRWRRRLNNYITCKPRYKWVKRTVAAYKYTLWALYQSPPKTINTHLPEFFSLGFDVKKRWLQKYKIIK